VESDPDRRPVLVGALATVGCAAGGRDALWTVAITGGEATRLVLAGEEFYVEGADRVRGDWFQVPARLRCLANGVVLRLEGGQASERGRAAPRRSFVPTSGAAGVGG
jgi:hypothetical protein